MWLGPYPAGLNYEYKYDDGNGKGDLSYEGKKIADILVLPVKNAELQTGSELVKHVNFLTCLFVDGIRQKLICVAPKVSVIRYLSNWRSKKAGRSGIMKYVIPNPFPTVTKKFTYYLSPEYRNIIRQLYRFVVDQHILGFSLTDFKLDDLWMGMEIDNVLKVSGVGFFEANEITRKEDFNRIIAVIKEMVVLDRESCPHVLADLVNETEEFNFSLDAKEEKILANHLAIIPPAETLEFIRKCSEELHDLRVNPKITNHHSKVQFNITVLSRVKEHENWRSKFADSGYYLIQQCYLFKGKYPGQEVATYHQTGIHCLVKYSMLRFARNLAVHLRGMSGLDLEDLPVEVMIMELFHEQLLTTHSSLHESGRLQEFMKMI